jgi:N-carbamoylputrescine amidase
MTADPKPFILGLIQMSMGPEPADNIDRALALLSQAAEKGAQVVCLPELFHAMYFCQREDPALFDLAEPIPGPLSERLSAAAAESGVVLVASLFEHRARGLYHNTAAVFEADGSLLGLYRKMHIPDDPGYYEKFYFTPGDTGFRVFETSAGRIGTLVCWDQWFPEAARLTAMRGADVLVYPTAIGWHPHEKAEFGDDQRDAWRTIQRSHAIANGVYVAAANRYGLEKLDGQEPGIHFWGGSFVCDPFGVMIAQGAEAREDIVLARIEPTRMEDVRRNWPFLRDRRIDAYAPLGRRFIDSPREA